MQRWFFLDDKAKLDTEVSVASFPSLIKDTGCLRKWTFNLIMNHDMLPNEIVAITGGCDNLGNWKPGQGIPMQHDEEDSNNWIATIDIPRDREVLYRYYVCAVDPSTENIIVRRWETHLHPRVIPELGDTSESHDIFGDVNGIIKIDRGWLTCESIIQFKFFNSPFIWKQRMKNRLLYVKVTPMNLRIHCDTQIAQSSIEDSLSNDTRENGVDVPIFCFAEVASLKYDDCNIKPQPQFGTACGPDDLVIFHITVSDPENVAYLIDLFAYSSKANRDEPPFHLGYHYILPNVLKRSEGRLELPITCATKHRPLGMMQVGYSLFKPFQAYDFDMKISFSRYWNKRWSGLDVGHRGSGTSFKAKDSVIRENTIASLKNAAAHGADMLEFDVQLSKDLVPVLYHDFHVYVSLKSKKKPGINDFLELPMSELTLEQLKNFKVYHVIEGRTGETRNFHNEDLEEHQPFPQLADVLDAIDPHVGFNIEIKCSQQLLDGTVESETPVDRNLYVDCILDVVVRKACSRRIVFSCFDADMCAMLRYKQNIYPVMFLTLGVTEKYPKYQDPRCNTIESAVYNARAMELLGIVAHTEDLLRDPTQINLATNQGLIIFCWGDDNNSKDTIQMLKEMGLHAIIYDKMHILSTKEVRESVFKLVQTKEGQNDLLKLQCLELRRWPDEPQERLILGENEKVLELEHQRQQLAMSTATSIASLLEQSTD